MKKFLITLLILLLSSGIFAQQGTSESLSLIQSIRVEKAKPEKKSGKWVAGKGMPSSVQTYDGAGNLVESIVYQENGDLFVKYVAKYEVGVGKTEDTYTDAKGVIRLKTIYQYDASKRLIGKLYFGAKGVADGEATVRYKNGRISEVITYNPKGVVTGRHEYVYNDQERTVERLIYVPTGLRGGNLTTYDAQGRMTESISYETNLSSDMRWAYHYDSRENFTDWVLRAGSSAVKWNYSYEFDAHGNWITKTVSPAPEGPGESESKPIDITQRTISYVAEATQPKQAPAWSLAQTVVKEELMSFIRGSVIKRADSGNLGQRLSAPTGRVNVPVIINEAGKVIAAVPYGVL